MERRARARWVGLGYGALLAVVGCADPRVVEETPEVVCDYRIKPVWRADSLPPGVYLATSGHGGYDCPGTQCGMDLVAVRFDPTAQVWARLRYTADPPVSGGVDATPHGEYLGWEMPFYAPVDGEIIACWRDIPEEEDDNDEPAACRDRPGGACQGGGNQLWIRTQDEKVVFLGHLRQGSIPEELCPIPAGTPPPGISGSGVTCSTGSPWTRMREDVDLHNFVAEYPTVKAGDFVGRMGSSGNSGEPHLHLGVYDYWEDPGSGERCYADRPYQLTQSWSQSYVAGVDLEVPEWEPRVCEVLAFGGTPRARYVILPDPVGPRVDAVSLAAGSSPALALTAGGGVAVYRNAAGVLAAQGFVFDAGGAFVRGAARSDDAVLAVDVAPVALTADHVVAAGRDDSGHLRLVPFVMGSDGELFAGKPEAEASVTAQRVAVTRAPTHDGVVVAVKNATDSLTVLEYGAAMSGTILTLTRNDTMSTGDAILEVDIATVDHDAWRGVVTAERDAGDVVWLRTWTVSATGALTAAAADRVRDVGVGGEYAVTDLDLAVTGGDGEQAFIVLSTIVSTSGTMRLSTYTIAGDGSFALADQFDADDVTDAPVTSLSSTRADLEAVVVGTRLVEGGSRLWSFEVDATGVLRRVGAVDTGTVTALVVGARPDADDMVVLTGEPGMLGMAHFRTNYGPPG